MNSIFVVVILFSAVQSQLIVNNGLPAGLLDKFQQFSTIYLQKCVKNLEPSQQQNLNKAVSEISSCVGAQNSQNIMEKDFCDGSGKKFISCVRSFTDVAKGCLDANEKYLPDLILNSQSRVLDKYCKDEYITRLTKITNASCKKPIAQALNADFLEKCVPKLRIIENVGKKDYSLNKADVCSDLKSVQDCLVNTFKTNCEISKEDTDLLNTIFLEYRTECNFANINMASFGLLALLFVVSKFFS